MERSSSSDTSRSTIAGLTYGSAGISGKSSFGHDAILHCSLSEIEHLSIIGLWIAFAIDSASSSSVPQIA